MDAAVGRQKQAGDRFSGHWAAGLLQYLLGRSLALPKAGCRSPRRRAVGVDLFSRRRKPSYARFARSASLLPACRAACGAALAEPPRGDDAPAVETSAAAASALDFARDMPFFNRALNQLAESQAAMQDDSVPPRRRKGRKEKHDR